MSEGRLEGARREAVLDAFDDALAQWCATDGFHHAVAETVARTGYAGVDVQDQLHHVVRRCRADVMRSVVAAEIGPTPEWSTAPSAVLVLASGRVPGLAIEGIAAALAVGAVALVRPSRDETVLHHLLGGLSTTAAELMERIDVVGPGGAPPPWQRADAAVVFGSDETIALVRDRLGTEGGAGAADRVAAYGSRQGVAVVLPGAEEDPSWAARLADDVLTFRQQGCMSPSWLLVVGAPEQTDRLVEQAGRELAVGGGRHCAPGVDTRVEQRRASDADVLGAIAAGLSPEPRALHAGDARLTVVRLDDERAMLDQVRQLGSLRQTAVVVAGRADRERIGAGLLEAGITRVCAPGQAHRPDPLWPQDGIGRIAPLLGAPALSARQAW